MPQFRGNLGHRDPVIANLLSRQAPLPGSLGSATCSGAHPLPDAMSSGLGDEERNGARVTCASSLRDQKKFTPFAAIGKWVTRGPFTAIALARAGPAGGVLGSPTPVGTSVDGTICVSMARMSLIRSGS